MKKSQDYDRSLLKSKEHKSRTNKWLVIGLLSMMVVIMIILILQYLSKTVSDKMETSATVTEMTSTTEEVMTTQTTQVITTDAVISSLNETLTSQEISQLFNRTLGTIKGEHSLFYQEILVDNQQTNQPFIMNNRSIRAASMIKLFILSALYEQAELGNINLEDTHILSADEKVGGTGSLQLEADSSQWTYRQLAHLMIAESDNTASNILIDTLGGIGAVQAIIKRQGYSQTELNRKFVDIDALNQGIDNYVTAHEIGDLLSKMYRGELVSKVASEAMLKHLAEQQYRDKLLANLSNDVMTYNKTGTYREYGVQSDAAIIETSQGTFVIVVLSEDGEASEQNAMLGQFGQLLTEQFISNQVH